MKIRLTKKSQKTKNWPFLIFSTSRVYMAIVVTIRGISSLWKVTSFICIEGGVLW